MNKSASSRRIVMIAFDGVQALDVVGPLDVFNEAARRSGNSINLEIVAQSKSVSANGGLIFNAQKYSELADGPIDLLLIPGGDAGAIGSAVSHAKTMRSIEGLIGRAHQIASICTGAFLLAPLGQLNERKVTTHWAGLDLLQNAVPSSEVVRGAMFVQDGNLWSSAGITAGIDLALAIVRRWFGHNLALEIARHLVVPLVRSDVQRAYADRSTAEVNLPPEFAGLLEFLGNNCHRKLKVEALSNAVGMSHRTFHRRCCEVFGVPPGKLLTNYRLDLARSLLINSSEPMKQIADRTGFANQFVLSHTFKKAFGMSPKAFREGLTLDC